MIVSRGQRDCHFTAETGNELKNKNRPKVQAKLAHCVYQKGLLPPSEILHQLVTNLKRHFYTIKLLDQKVLMQLKH